MPGHILIYCLIIDNEINLIDDLIPLTHFFDRPVVAKPGAHMYSM